MPPTKYLKKSSTSLDKFKKTLFKRLPLFFHQSAQQKTTVETDFKNMLLNVT